MKHFIIMIIVLTSLSQTSPILANSGYKIGISFGGSQFVALSVEKFFSDNSFRLNLGFFEIHEICLSGSFNHYFLSSKVRPFMGIGIWDVLAVTPRGIGSLTLLNIPIGVDWNVKDRHFLGAEVDVNYGFFCIDPEGRKEAEKILLPFPGIYYKYKL